MMSTIKNKYITAHSSIETVSLTATHEKTHIRTQFCLLQKHESKQVIIVLTLGIVNRCKFE